MTHRFFVPPAAIVRDQVTLGAENAHQLKDVLRMRPGSHVTVLDNSGRAYEVELVTLQRDVAFGRICGQKMLLTEPRLSLTLYQCTLKGERFEWVLQKGTELGVSTFVPVFSSRSVVREVQRIEKKRTRWERIIREAAEQSHRGRLPRLADPLTWAQACQTSVRDHELALIPWEEAQESGLSDVLRSLDRPPNHVALLIGPEGGLEVDEIAMAQHLGMRVVTLGSRILRAETAGLAAMAIVMSELGEMGGLQGR